MTPESPRYLAMQAAHQRDFLARYPEARAEAVAQHYASLAETALDLLELVKMRRYAGIDHSKLDGIIERQLEIITEAHARDLGLPLQWDSSPEPRD